MADAPEVVVTPPISPPATEPTSSSRRDTGPVSEITSSSDLQSPPPTYSSSDPNLNNILSNSSQYSDAPIPLVPESQIKPDSEYQSERGDPDPVKTANWESSREPLAEREIPRSMNGHQGKEEPWEHGLCSCCGSAALCELLFNRQTFMSLPPAKALPLTILHMQFVKRSFALVSLLDEHMRD